MNSPLFVQSNIEIHAPAATVWDMLTNPAQTKKYMFGCEALSDWKVGSPLVWKGKFDGIEMIPVKGNILEIRPPHRLVYTVFGTDSKVEDIPDNYLTVTCDLLESGGKTSLAVTQGDYSKVADGEKRYEDTAKGGGWDTILVEIKKLAEANLVTV
jgi:uncharacterized protein YndB with AHSA1/START domain